MALKSLIKDALTVIHKHQKEDKDVYIFTLPRSGSTLLAEILNMDPACKLASEPFALNQDNKAILKRYFSTHDLQERYTELSKANINNLFKYFRALSSGKTWNSYYWSDWLKGDHKLQTTRTIFKTHRVSYWWESLLEFEQDYALYLLRHPISHSLSRLRNNWTTYIDQFSQAPGIRENLSSDAKDMINRIRQKGSGLEKFVLSWGLENFNFLRKMLDRQLPKNIIPVFYEELLFSPGTVLKAICRHVDIPYQQKMLKRIHVPSKGIVHSTKNTELLIKEGNNKELLGSWRREVNNETEKQLLNILETLSINCYLPGNDLPDKSGMLQGFSDNSKNSENH